MNYTEIIQDICSSMVEKFNTPDRSDKSFKVKVTGKINASKYKVLYCGDTHIIASDEALEIGQFVWICVPCNNWNNAFFVKKTTGRVTG